MKHALKQAMEKRGMCLPKFGQNQLKNSGRWNKSTTKHAN